MPQELTSPTYNPGSLGQRNGLDYLEEGIDNIGKRLDFLFRYLYRAFYGIFMLIRDLVEWALYGNEESL